MSALGDAAAALIPPEEGGPPPERVASVARHLLDAMPAVNRAAFGAGLLALEGLALARYRRPLGRLPHERRAALLTSIGERGAAGAAALDALKAVLMMAAGADEYAETIRSVAAAAPVARPDPKLRMLGREELAAARPDAIVVGSGAGGAFAAREMARAGLDVLVLEEGERWDSARLRAAHPIERFAGLYRDAGSTIAAGLPPIALPLGRAVGGTTVLNSGTCFRPPAPVVAEWRSAHGLGAGLIGADYDDVLADVEATIGVGPVPLEIMGRNGRLALAGADALGFSAAPLRRNATGCRAS